MLNSHWQKLFTDTRGGALTEFAVSFPLLLLLCLGATDFGRLFFDALTVANAAWTGAFYGAQNNVNFAKRTIMANRAIEDAKNLENVTANATSFCECPGNPPTAISCDQATNRLACGDYGYPRAYVQTNLNHTFQTLVGYPGIPNQTVLDRSAYMRVQ
jgi:Flp pilus assembly protein TadG